MIYEITNLYALNKNEESKEKEIIQFEKVNPCDVRICGKTLSELETIINGLETERITEIKMTMENLSYLYNKLISDTVQSQRELINKVFCVHL